MDLKIYCNSCKKELEIKDVYSIGTDGRIFVASCDVCCGDACDDCEVPAENKRLKAVIDDMAAKLEEQANKAAEIVKGFKL